MKKLFLISILGLSSPLYSAHPLITDDTGVQGKRKFQWESNLEYGVDKENGDKFKYYFYNNVLSFGVNDNSDLIISLPYVWWKDYSADLSEKGISDLSFELKYKFYQKESLSLAVKPGFSFPSGDHKKDLGSGKIGYGGFFILSKEYSRGQIHFNIGYLRNENKLNENKDIYKISFGTFISVKDNLNLVLDSGFETNSDKDSDSDPGFLIVGFIYSPYDNFDLDMGIKRGITSSETDTAYMIGITRRW